jgi:hypothetical protein
MAEITLSSGSVCRPFRTPWGAFNTRSYFVSTGVSSAAIHVGRPVTLDYTEAGMTTNAGYVKASTADNTFYLVGIAASAASGSTATVGVTDVQVYEANPLAEFQANTKGGAVSSSLVGTPRTLHWDSTLNIAYVDITGSTAADFRVVVTQAPLTGYSQSDTGAPVAFRFISNRREQGSTINSSTPFLAFYR